MKNHPEKHKTQNLFKFKSFYDRISQVDIRKSALYHIEHVNEDEAGENETEFHQCYDKWIGLNLSDEFGQFQKAIRKVVTLPQLLHKKDFIVEHLIKFLKVASNLSLEPLLEFIIALAKDLRGDFYPYFPDFLEILIKLLNTKDPDELEWTLICLAYLFKTLKPFLKKDFTVVFTSVLPLLDESHPVHITNFAAECFSFVVRDIRDKEQFIEIVIKKLEKHRKGIMGCGRLFFEIVRGVGGLFHSCAGEFIKLVFSSLKNTKINTKLLFEVTVQMITDIMESVKVDNIGVFWDALLAVLEESIKTNASNECLDYLLQYIGQAVEFKQCVMIHDSNQLINHLISLLDTDVSEEISLTTSRIGAVVLLGENVKITQLDSSRLCRKILSTSYKSVFEEFIWNTVDYAQFEMIVFPEFLKYFDLHFSEKCLQLLVKIILSKIQTDNDTKGFGEFKKFPFKLKTQNNLKKIKAIIEETTNLESLLTSPSNFIMAIIFFTHVEGVDVTSICTKVTCLIDQILNKVCLKTDETLKTENLSTNRVVLFILSNLLQFLIVYKKNIDNESLISTLLPYLSDHNYNHVFQIIDSVISNSTGKFLSENLFNQLHPILSQNLSSPSQKQRYLSAHILSKFPKEFILKVLNVDGETRSPYEMICEIELATPNVHNFRELLQILEKFNYNGNFYQQALKDTQIKYDPMHYLLAVFHVNFKLLWEPVTKLIVSYAENISPHEMWSIIKPPLIFCDDYIANGRNFSVPNIEEIGNDVLQEKFVQSWTIADRLDLINYRVLLLTTISKCRTLPEVKNRDIITIFLKFWENEFKLSDDELQLTVSVLKKDSTNYKSKVKSKIHQGSHRTLAAFLEVFSKIPSPRSNYKEATLNAIYHELLASKNDAIQKSALDCIIAYKHKYLTPYKDHLYKIIDDKTFRSQMVDFQIDVESKVIQEEHRINFIPILFRVLHCKMGMRLNSKQESGLNRKTLILRFLSNCPESEFFEFIKILFANITEFIGGRSIDEILKNIDLEHMMHYKKIQSAVSLLEIIVEQFCGMMGNDVLRYLIEIICGIGAALNAVIEQTDIIEPKYIGVFKKIRNDCVNILTQFFGQFDAFPWTSSEIDVVFKLYIAPHLKKLHIECIHSPTPLLKLLLEFSKNPRYHVLFSKYLDNTDVAPIPCLMSLFSNAKPHNSVVRVIMDIVDNLLTLDINKTIEDDEVKAPVIEITNKIPIDTSKMEKITISDQLNYGSCILLPYIPHILDKIRKNLVLSKSRSLNKRDLNILSRVTELVTDSETSDKLLALLYPVLSKRTRATSGDDFIMQMITTLTNLILKSNNPESHLRNIAPLFESVSTLPGRKMLCQLITKMTSPESLISQITTGLNALDQRWIDQPDYEKRLDTMKQIGKLTEANDIDMNLCLIVIYHCFYFLKHDKDLAMRDSAGLHLKSVTSKTLLKYHSSNEEEVVYLVEHVVLNIVRRTLRDKNDSVRNEGIMLLGELARECSHCHPILKDLNPLTDKNDREIDFFDNVTHLQSHRHGRALLKFCQVAKTYEVAPKPRTLTQFILPLATHYICNETFAKKHSVVESAIQAIGAVCFLLPWFQYETLLKFYLNKLKTNIEYQKQIVRLVMSILDAFHFDLSRANVITSELPKLEDIEDEEFNAEKKTNGDDDDKEEVEKIEKFQNIDDEDENTIDDQLEIDPGIEEDNDDEDEPSPKKKKSADIFTILSPKAAKRLIETISHGILPALNNAIVRLTTHDTKHKVNRRKNSADKEDEDSLRVPIALAIVKLLQKLPEGMLDHNLPGIFMKICTFLKSHLKSIRMLTRDILRKIMLAVGPSRLELLLNHMTALLTRGYQCHVLTVTIHSVLDALKNEFRPGDIDKSLQNILSICIDDIFGKRSEEKEVEKLGVNTPEAKPSNKSYMTLNIIATNITEASLLDLIVPFKKHLADSQSKKVIFKVQESFKKVMTGLIENRNISVESLLIFIYGLASESIPDLLPGTAKPTLTPIEKERLQRHRPDIYIIPEPPRMRSGNVRKVVKTNNQANAHILIEFGLDMLYVIIKRKKYGEIDCEPYLDPLVPIIQKSLQSTHVRVTTYALKCLSTIWNQKLNLNNLKSCTPDVVSSMFKMIHKYAAVGMSTNDENYHLVKNIFKSMMAILRFVNYYTISEEQLKTLLLYVEQDLHSNEKQSFAFSLLKSILGKKLHAPEINDVMQKVAEISILSESATVREETRSIFLNYLINYPLGKKVLSYLRFFINQLEYEVTSGRQSAISMISSIIKKFPINILQLHSGFIFLSLSARLVNDEVTECRVQIAETIEQLITRLEKNSRNDLFDIVVLLLNDKKPSHREMAAQLCIRFINVEKDDFKSRLKSIFPNLISRITNHDESKGGKFVKLRTQNDDDDDDIDEDTIGEDGIEVLQKIKDHQLIQYENCVIKIFETFENILVDPAFAENIDELAYECQTLLAYDHVWVRLNSAKILQFIFSTTNIEQIETILNADDDTIAVNDSNPRSFIYNNPRLEIKSLIIDHCSQLFPGDTDVELTEQVMKNILHLANFLKNIPFDEPLNVISILRRIRFVIHAEVAKAPHSITLRTACFNWISAFVTMLNSEQIKHLAEMILTPLVREMSEEDTTIDPQLRQIALKIGNKIKKRLGEDDYNIWRSKIQLKLMRKRAERKKVLAQEKINDPERAEHRRVGIQMRKKQSKKRKIDVIRGKALPTKRRRRSIDDFF